MEKKFKIEKKLTTIVIVGRINVGKSMLFNRLTETGRALVSDIEGTTRDYNVGLVSWRNKNFELIDTGGININTLKHSIQSLLPGKKSLESLPEDVIEKEIVKQTKLAMQKADMILMVTDGQTGLMPEDKELALVLKKIKKPIFLISNKVDSQKYATNLNEFYKLGLGKPWPVSAANGSGTGDMLDELIKKVKGQKGRPKTQAENRALKVAIIGKPNVGKSSLLNAILGEERVIVSPIPHTTREPQDTEIIYNDQKIEIIDTAGLRKKAKIERGLEKLSTRRSLNLIKAADIIIFVTEADKPLTVQDLHLAGMIKDAGAGIIVVANKWDLIGEKNEKTDSKFLKYYQRHFPFLSFAPLIFISAQTGKNVHKILDLVMAVNNQRKKIIDQPELDAILKGLVKKQHPAQAKGQNPPRLISLEQIKSNPPQFNLSIGRNDSVHFSYLRFIENQLRERFDFIGTPINLKVTNVKVHEKK